MDFDFTLGTDPKGDFRQSDEFQDIKAVIHQRLVERIEDLSVDFSSWSAHVTQRFVQQEVEDFVANHRAPLNMSDIQVIVKELTHELTGLGPLQELIDDDAVADILVNGYKEVFTEKNGLLQRSSVRFIDNRHLMRIIQRMIAPLGRRVDEGSPMVDARLPNGGRLNVIIPPVSLNGPVLSIRKFRAKPLQASDMLAYGTLNQDMLDFLAQATRMRCNILISGGTGSGKTSFLNMLAQFIPDGERVITIEDAAELQLLHEHVVRLESRPGGLENTAEVTPRDLLRNSLRMRPDRIIVGEVRGGEAVDMLQAMNTGHDGSMSTIHTNSPRECMHRLEMLLHFGGWQGSEFNLRRQIAGAVDLIVQLARLSSGARRVMSISEITGMQDDVVAMQELYRFDPGPNGREGVFSRPCQPQSQKLAKIAFALGRGGGE
ncbi:CpaF family protein [Azonexus sp.]|uniref:CpaF family protein n=1 Tax=Azonexus sp. TaxID=1872668 RepID=UPI0039E462FC